MRLDKYLKNSRLIKRRTVAKDACIGDKVYLNGKQAKPSAEVKVGDVIEIVFGEKSIKAEIVDISANATKVAAKEMYKII
ncbi:MAG TPA: RNA-binding S4 domain-containing protein [Patescibacteria group bacterium]|nr:RNA-binding S4 domain-containing protein [Patescibacteria group bacterium]